MHKFLIKIYHQIIQNQIKKIELRHRNIYKAISMYRINSKRNLRERDRDKNKKATLYNKYKMQVKNVPLR